MAESIPPDVLGGPHAGNHAVVTIGIDRYEAWPHLGNAVNDARKTSEVFRRLGFRDAHALINEAATGDAIRKLVTDDLSTLGVNDSLVIFFAGHGATTTRILADDTKLKTGYIIPVDAENKPDRLVTWIRLDTWLDDIARLPPNHILVILDACHSGIALDALVKWRDLNSWQSEPLDELSRRRSRRVIVSALDDQLALDSGPIAGHSLFTGCLIQALTEDLLRDGRQAATGTELGLHLQRRVMDYPNSRQTPDFGAFELDDRGELVIPLVAIDPPPSQPPVVEREANTELRRELAATLAELVPDRAAAARLLTAHAPMISVAELSTAPTATIWRYALVELTNRNLFSEMSAVIEAVRRDHRRSGRIDWTRFDPVVRPPDGPVIASWSHLTLELRRDNTGLITDGDLPLEAVATLQWRGLRPDDPSIQVTSSRLFGSAVPLAHEVTQLPSHGPGTASWLVKIIVPRARIRTRVVTVRCAEIHPTARHYLVPRAGSIFAAAVWFAFAAFVCYWLSPISRLLVTAPLTVFGVLSGLWAPIAVHLLRGSYNKRAFGSFFLAWELAVLVTALAAALAIAVPPRVLVLVTNTTKTDVRLDKIRTIPSGAVLQVYPASIDGWRPAPPFCRCGDTPACQECDRPLVVNGVHHVVLGCLENDCSHIIEHSTSGGTARIVRTIGIHVSPAIFEPGAASPQMQAPAGDPVVTARDVLQNNNAIMPLPILPDGNRGYSIAFSNYGVLRCDARATRIRRLEIDQPVGHAVAPTTMPLDHVDFMIGATHSTWTGVPGEARACADQAGDHAQVLTVSVANEEVHCTGGPVARILALEVTPPATRLWLKIGQVETSWSAKTDAKFARACLGKPGDLALPRLAPGVHVALPKDLELSRVLVRREQADPRSAVSVRCHPGDTLRTVRLVNVASRETIRIGPALVERLDATTGATCDAPAILNTPDQVCRLDDAELRCSTIYHGDCHLHTNNRIAAGRGSADDCPLPVSPADRPSLLEIAGRTNLLCREIYQCER